MLPRTSVIRLSSRNGPNSDLLFRCRRIDFGDSAQAVGFGRMRPRDEGSANLGRVPAGFHTETKPFFSHDVTGREVLHQVLSVGPFHFGWNAPDEVLTHRANTGLFRSLPPRVGQGPQVPRPRGRGDACRSARDWPNRD